MSALISVMILLLLILIIFITHDFKMNRKTTFYFKGLHKTYTVARSDEFKYNEHNISSNY